MAGKCIIFFLPALLLIQTAAFSGRSMDALISRAVETEFILDPNVPAHTVRVESFEGRVVLSGTVSTLLAQERMIEITRSMEGVHEVVDLTRFNPRERPDPILLRRVLSALSNERALAPSPIQVRVSSGIVILSGAVNSWVQREIAARAAMGVEGVRRLNNNIAVDFRPGRSDRELAGEIRWLLQRNPRVAHNFIQVEVFDGEVFLHGKVGSMEELELAREEARLPGVKFIETAGLKIDPHQVMQRRMARDRAEQPLDLRSSRAGLRNNF
jgi:osmotically-inducible protein OsmY